jgi:hypothetical protein
MRPGELLELIMQPLTLAAVDRASSAVPLEPRAVWVSWHDIHIVDRESGSEVLTQWADTASAPVTGVRVLSMDGSIVSAAG